MRDGRLGIVKMAMLEFVPTSTHRNWKGKFRCKWCKASGWTWVGCVDYHWWWGHRHGKNCSKRPPAKQESEALRLRQGIEKIITDRYAGDFDGLIPKMRALLARMDRELGSE